MEINLTTAARLLGISEAMLRRLALQGKIPSHERHGRLFFPLESLRSWAKRRNIPLRGQVGTHSMVSAKEEITLFEAMRRGDVFFDVPGKDIKEVLKNAIYRIPLSHELDRETLIERLLERESLASTGIGKGVAIPHPRQPIGEIPEGGIISTCFLKEEVDFNSVDGTPVFVLFLMLSHNTRNHLKLLSRLSYCLREERFITFLKGCRNKDEFFEMIKNMEKRFFNP
jgi:PTS system nitrogen regulatory IIA component